MVKATRLPLFEIAISVSKPHSFGEDSRRFKSKLAIFLLDNSNSFLSRFE